MQNPRSRYFRSDSDTEATMGDHQNLSCDGCLRHEFRGRRFRCMRCINYDLCGDCYDQRIETQSHRSTHPMQLVLEPVQELGPTHGGGVSMANCFTCPHCGILGYTAKQLIKHVCDQHCLSEDPVACPMCATSPTAALRAIRKLSRHLLLHHLQQANDMEPDTPRLRRILGRSSQGSRVRLQLQVRSEPQRPHWQRRAIPAIDDVAVPQKPQGRSGDDLEPSGSANQGFLLPRWMAEQESRSRDPEKEAIQKQNHALFTEQLMLSMLCDEELELPGEKTTQERVPMQQHGPCKDMSPMSVPWTGLRHVSQGRGLWNSAGGDTPRDEASQKQGPTPEQDEETIG